MAQAKMMALAVALALATTVAHAQSITGSFAGIEVTSNVTEHSEIDQDIVEMARLLNANDPAGALRVFRDGFASEKTTPTGQFTSMRTLAGFSDATKLREVPVFAEYEQYYSTPDYAKKFVERALGASSGGDAPFAGLDADGRRELAVKGSQFMSVFMYALYEGYKAKRFCEDTTVDTAAALHSWNEVVAFYVGSLQDSNNGQLGFALAEKRANRPGDNQFLTLSNGLSWVNANATALLQEGRAHIRANRCSLLGNTLEQLRRQWTIPLIQGMLRYLRPELRTGTQKGRAEGVAFALAVLPQINKCDSRVASRVRSLVVDSYLNAPTSADPITAAVATDLEQEVASLVLGEGSCASLGITCEDVWNFDAVANGQTLRRICSRSILGFTPGSLQDVRRHARIDLDVRDLHAALDAGRVSDASSVWQNGVNSFKIDDNGVQVGMRSLQSLSRAGLLAFEPFDHFVRYWGTPTYAREFVERAFSLGSGFEPVVARELGVKGSQLQVVRMYIIHELAQAVAKCKSGDKDGAIHSWDEGWAFYVGKTEVASNGENGFLGYALARKRFPQFKNGENLQNPVLDVNTRLLGLFNKGLAELQADRCDAALRTGQDIGAYMTVPVLQGLIRYIVLGLEQPTQKHRAELWAFTAAVLPQLDLCNAGAAKILRNQSEAFMQNPAYTPEWNPKQLTNAVYDALPCMGLRCEDVGTFVDNGVAKPEGAGCANWKLSKVQVAGYKSDTDITEHARIDQDIAAIKAHLFDKDTPDYAAALQIYQNGGGASFKRPQQARTVQGFTDHAKLNAKSTLYAKHRDYWTARGKGPSSGRTYADAFVRDALDGRGDLAGKPHTMRREVALKSMQFQAVFMYVVYEMEDAISDCYTDPLSNMDSSVSAWDEAAAFYAGSLVGALGETTVQGQLHYTLAEMRSPQFQTPGTAQRTLALLQAGQLLVRTGLCSELPGIFNKVVAQMLVPLMQGLFRYAYLADPKGGNSAAMPKVRGEGYAFANAILPHLHACSPTVAELVRRNFAVGGASSVQDGHMAVINAVTSQFACMGIKPSEVGAMVGSDGRPLWTAPKDPNPLAGTNEKEGCEDDDEDSSHDHAEIVALSIAVAVLSVLCAVFLFALCTGRVTRSKNVSHDGVTEVELNGEAAGAPKSDVAQV